MPDVWKIQQMFSPLLLRGAACLARYGKAHENCCKKPGENVSFPWRCAHLSETCPAGVKELLKLDFKEPEPDCHEEGSDW